MPALSTFGASSTKSFRPNWFKVPSQYFAIGGGGGAKLDSLTVGPVSGYGVLNNVSNTTHTTQSPGYPGKIASNTQYVGMLSSQTLRYPATGTNSNGSGIGLSLAVGETYSVVIGAGGGSSVNGTISGVGGSTTLIKNGTTIFTANGGAKSPGSQVSYTGKNWAEIDASVYAKYNAYTYCDCCSCYTVGPFYYYMRVDTALPFRPESSNGAQTLNTSYYIDAYSGGNWNNQAINWFGASYSNLPHGRLGTNGINYMGEPIKVPFLPDQGQGIAGGTGAAHLQSRMYFDMSQQYSFYTGFAYGDLSNYTMGFSWQDYLDLNVQPASGYNFGSSGGAAGAETVIESGYWFGSQPGADGGFFLAYPANLPALSSTVGLASTGSSSLTAAGLTSNPQVVTISGSNYRVYVWAASGSFTV